MSLSVYRLELAASRIGLGAGPSESARMRSLLQYRRLHHLVLTVPALACALIFAASAQASACAGADPCPWTQTETFGDVGDGEFRAPYGIGTDAGGNLYVVEQDTHRVQKLDPNGAFIAKWGRDGSAEGELYYPYDIAVDAAHGGVYVSDRENNRIEKFDTNGNFVSAWGWGVDDGSAAYQVCTQGCQAGSAGPGSGQLKGPRGIATDGTNVYVADWSNKRIQKFDLAGNVTGQWTIGAQQAPERLAAAGGKVYATTSSDVVWRFDSGGTPDNSWDGDGVSGSSGTGAGQFDYPEAIAVDGTGVYVVDYGNQRIQKLDSSGAFVTMWGWGVADGTGALQTCSSSCQTGIQGSGDGQFNDPFGVVATGGSVWVADSYNHRLQRFSQSGSHQLTVGSVGPGEFESPADVAVAPSGDLYVADMYGHDVQRLDASGNPLTRWFTGNLSFPSSVTPSASGVYVPVNPGYLRLFDPSGNLLDQLTTPGPGAGQLSTAAGSTSDADGNIYVTERINDRVKKFDPAGNSLAVFGASGSGDGQLDSPYDVAVDAAGNVYVAERGNNRVQKFDAAGNFLLKWGAAGSGDGQFSGPSGIAVDAQGHVFVSDTFNHRIQEFDGQGHFLSKWGAHGDGPGELYWPEGLAVDAAGAVVVADNGNHRIVRFCCPGVATPAGAAGEQGPAAGTPGAGTPAADAAAARIGLSGGRVQRARRVRRRGVALRITTNEPANVSVRATLSRRDARRLGLRSARIGRASLDLGAAGTHALRLRLSARARRALLRIGRRKPRILVHAAAVDRAGNRSSASFAVTIKH
jgi:tripartite motif-containing protein 71